MGCLGVVFDGFALGAVVVVGVFVGVVVVGATVLARAGFVGAPPFADFDEDGLCLSAAGFFLEGGFDGSLDGAGGIGVVV